MSLTGVWMNELKSIMVLREHSDGTLIGKYRSLVGRDPHTRHLTGVASTDEGGKQIVGFVVRFQVDNPGLGYGHYSVCTWSGWIRDNEITTHWLLTLSLLNQVDEWSSTLIGEDSFEKVSDDPNDEHLESDMATLKTLLTNARTSQA